MGAGWIQDCFSPASRLHPSEPLSQDGDDSTSLDEELQSKPGEEIQPEQTAGFPLATRQQPRSRCLRKSTSVRTSSNATVRNHQQRRWNEPAKKLRAERPVGLSLLLLDVFIPSEVETDF